MRATALAALLAALAGVPAAGAVTTHPQTPHDQTLTWGGGGTFATFQPGDAISVYLGTFGSVGGCANGNDDQFPNYATDVYIVPTGAAVGDALHDVSGNPNTEAGMEGPVFGDSIDGGLLGVAGVNVPAGTYAVVYDECQDGTIDDDDAIFDPALTVNPPVGGEIPAISPAVQAIKTQAGRQALSMAASAASWEVVVAMDDLSGVADKAECLIDALSCIDVAIDLYESHRGKDQLMKAMSGYLQNTTKHYADIAADPPDPDYAKPTTLEDATAAAPEGTSPLERAQTAFFAAVAREGALGHALLHAVERYQGAAAAGDRAWALVHAREVDAFSTALADQIEQTAAALTAYRTALAAAPEAADAETARAALKAIGGQLAGAGGPPSAWSVRFANAGLGDADVAALKTYVGSLDLGRTRTAALGDLEGLAGEESGDAAAYRAAAGAARQIAGTLAADPVVVAAPPPTADAGGPYTGTQGQAMALDAGGSGVPAGHAATYAWDLDGDGQFDDASGPQPSYTPAAPFDGLAVVKVTDTSSGLSSVDVAPLSVAAANHPPTVGATAPAGAAVTVRRGTTQAFSVTPADPDPAQTTTVAWTLDGAAAGSGSSWSSDFATAALGLHVLRATVTDSSGAANATATRTWVVAVRAADADGDGWSANVDCDDHDPSVHPRAAEVAGNGRDDDCDGSTPDTVPGGGGGPVLGGGDQGQSPAAPLVTPSVTSTSTPTPAISLPAKPATKKPPCSGLKGRKLVVCKADLQLKRALAACRKRKAKARATCVRRAKAVHRRQVRKRR